MKTSLLKWPEVERRCKYRVAELLNIQPDEISLESKFEEDLGADSLDTVEILIALEEEFEIQIPTGIQDPGVATTIADGIQYMLRHEPRALLRKIDTKIVAFSLRPDGQIEVSIQMEDGSWTYAGGHSILPSKLYLVTFSKWGNILKQLEDLINDPKMKEKDLQKFFEEYPELLVGDDYDEVIPQATISRDIENTGWKADFVLAPVNQTDFCKIVELKVPGIPIIKRPRSGHLSFSARVWSGICQLKDYYRAFDKPETRHRFMKSYNIDVYKPDLHLIAGRRWDLQWVDNIRELLRETEIKVEDWDSVINRLKRKYA